MAKVGFWLQGAHGQIAGANLSQSPGGATIMRKNGHPTNPQTKKQCDQRAKFKLMSQIAAAFKSVIAIPREGEKSPRNIFVKQNFGLVTIQNEGETRIDYASLQLTKSAIPAPSLDGHAEGAGRWVVAIEGAEGCDKAIAVGVMASDESESFLTHKVQEVALTNGAGSTTMTYTDNNLRAVIVYGVLKDVDANAKAKFEDMKVSDEGDTEAYLGWLRATVGEGTSVTRCASSIVETGE